MFGVAQFSSIPLDTEVLQITLAGVLGLFLGLEREWSHKSAGVRTFSLISMLGAAFTVLGSTPLVVVGGVLVIVQGTLLAVRGLLADDEDEDQGLSLTTSMSMLVAYAVGTLVASAYTLEAVTVTVFSALLLVLKRELHSFAWGMTRTELRSAAEFAILAFVVYPLLPARSYELGAGDLMVEVEPRVVWLMVVTVAAIGIVNYAIVQTYGSRGIAVTGFFGGLASSTAVVGAMLDHVEQRPAVGSYAVAAILLADAAMAARNLVIALAFTFETGLLLGAVVPLGAVILGSVAIAGYTADWSENLDMDLESPFSLRNVLSFGGLFLVVIVAGGLAAAEFGRLGFYVTAALTGLVSSAGATTSAVILYRGGGLSAEAAVFAILLATASSIVVKAGLTFAGPDREFAVKTATASTVLLVAAGAVTTAATM
ncbi:magnesium transporter accessory protein [Halosimplex carlsbadense 2-9-1]|uniref:Magnesium transporter accessory protein n=1 Tax=Halosimplex carlsbadense 2-9-1 TaxID=797114 RepID=M0CNR0_9EURY|nr:MgtC/SapB family protein [Halosimplex carlsbadense]ELZ24910.1 magnesium transporter accessory protein [Halosimplex carlsbadense 2-9-1]